MAGTAVRTSWGAVSVDTDHLGFDIRDEIQAGDRKAGIDRRHSRSHTQCISAEIGNETRAESDDPSIAPGCKFGILNLVASMRCREETFASPFYPGARAAGAHREKRATDFLGIKPELGAKCATNIWNHEPQFMKRQP